MIEPGEPREGLLTRWTVKDGLCSNITGKTADEVLAGLVGALDSDGRAILGGLEYCQANTGYSYDPASWNIVVFTVRGGSEGWYLHVEQVRDGKLRQLVLAKTLDSDPANIKRLERMFWDTIQAGE